MSDTQLMLISIGMPFLLSLAAFLFTFLLSLLPVDRQDQVKNAITSVVRSVEQSMPGATNEEKKANAVKLAHAVLAELHLPINPQMIDVLIEDAVFHLPQTNSAGAGVPVEPGS